MIESLRIIFLQSRIRFAEGVPVLGLLFQVSRSDVVLSLVANSTSRLIASARDGRSFWRRRQSSTRRKNSSDTRI